MLEGILRAAFFLMTEPRQTLLMPREAGVGHVGDLDSGSATDSRLIGLTSSLLVLTTRTHGHQISRARRDLLRLTNRHSGPRRLVTAYQ